MENTKNSMADNSAINPGDVVTIRVDAVYYTGARMPDWVKNDRWIVKSVNGARVVLEKNESGARDINSPVNKSFLTVVGHVNQETTAAGTSAPKQAPAQPKQTSQTPVATAGEMQVSVKGVELVAKYEGCRLEAYKCPAGVWTIGYGHTAGVNPGDKLPSVEAAKELLRQDLKKYGSHVNNCVKKGFITFPLTQNQFDALTSFCYNCGSGSLQKLVKGRNAATVAEKMLEYCKAGGKVLKGLERRRAEERALFLS